MEQRKRKKDIHSNGEHITVLAHAVTGSGEDVLAKIDDITRNRIDYIGDDLLDVANWMLNNE